MVEVRVVEVTVADIVGKDDEIHSIRNAIKISGLPVRRKSRPIPIHISHRLNGFRFLFPFSTNLPFYPSIIFPFQNYIMYA